MYVYVYINVFDINCIYQFIDKKVRERENIYWCKYLDFCIYYMYMLVIQILYF